MKKLACLLGILLLLSCGPQEAPATKTPTLVPSPTPTPPPPPPVRLEGFEGVRTIRLVVEQHYPECKADFSLPIAERCRQFLTRAGIQAVAEGAAEYDATLSIALTAIPLSAEYDDVILYTGAEGEGSISLSAPGAETYVRTFHVRRNPTVVAYVEPYNLEQKERYREGAPYTLLWREPFLLAMYDIWGVEAVIPLLEEPEAFGVLLEIGPEAVPGLIQVLNDEDATTRARCVAARLLGKLGPEPGVVPALIQALEDESALVRKNAASALGKIGPDAKEATGALTRVAESDPDENVRRRAASALERITGH